MNTATLRNTVFWPRYPMWLMVTAAISVISLLAYWLVARVSAWQPGRLGGLIAGSIAAALFVNAALYPARRKLRARPLGTAQRWLQLHIYGALFATVLVLVHIGFRLPAGMLGWMMFVLTLWTGLTGLVGVYLQKTLPKLMARNLSVEVIFERIPEFVERLLKDADARMIGADALADRAYRSGVRSLLEAPAPSWSYVFDPQGNRTRRLDPLSQLEPFLAGADKERLEALSGIVRDKLDLDAHMSLQRALRAWLIAHVPAAALLLALVTVHFFAVVYL
jgi:hypothetical protein